MESDANETERAAKMTMNDFNYRVLGIIACVVDAASLRKSNSSSF